MVGSLGLKIAPGRFLEVCGVVEFEMLLREHVSERDEFRSCFVAGHQIKVQDIVQAHDARGEREC